MNRNFLTKLYFLMLIGSTTTIHQSYDDLKFNNRTFTLEEKNKIVDLHNKLRRQECASDMQHVTWYPLLEKLAYDWVIKCDMKHSRGAGGENLAAHVNKDIFDSIENGWYNREKPKWCYGKLTSKGVAVAGHYTQIVQRDVSGVGCARKKCKNLKNSPFKGREVWFEVCRYYGRGNVVPREPYKLGKPCTKCSRTEVCCGGLCIANWKAEKMQKVCKAGLGLGDGKCEMPGAEASCPKEESPLHYASGSPGFIGGRFPLMIIAFAYFVTAIMQMC